MPEKVSVKIQEELWEDVDSHIEESNFGTVDEYIEFVVRNLLYQLEEELEEPGSTPDEDLENHLKSLGYLE